MSSEIRAKTFIQRPLKQRDLMRCAHCGKGVCHNRAITFFRVRLARMAIDPRTVQQQHGLEMMLGGHVMLAYVMGVDADMAVSLGEGVEFNLCDECAMNCGVMVLDEEASSKIAEIVAKEDE